VESDLGKGSRFWFTLPLVEGREASGALPHEPGAVSVPLDAKLAPGQHVTALVVDDSTASRRILASLLESAGVAVLSAAGGFEALDLARSHRPDIIFMDLKMDDLDGLEATRRLAQAPITSAIPVIAVTASAIGDVRQAARAAGCTDYLAKPVRVQLLLGMLQAHLGVRFVSEGHRRPSVSADRIADTDRRAEISTRLRNALEVGDISAIHALAEQLVKGSAAEAAVGDRIGRLAITFDFNGLRELAGELMA